MNILNLLNHREQYLAQTLLRIEFDEVLEEIQDYRYPMQFPWYHGREQVAPKLDPPKRYSDFGQINEL